jgi:transposase-like protein
MMIILPDVPPHVLAARRWRKIEESERMRQAIGVPCPKCGHKNLQNGGYSGGSHTTSRHYRCARCHIQYARIAEHRDVWDRETWERHSEVVRMYVENTGDLDAAIRAAVAAHPYVADPPLGATRRTVVRTVAKEGYLKEHVAERIDRLIARGVLETPAAGLVRVAEGAA